MQNLQAWTYKQTGLIVLRSGMHPAVGESQAGPGSNSSNSFADVELASPCAGWRLTVDIGGHALLAM